MSKNQEEFGRAAKAAGDAYVSKKEAAAAGVDVPEGQLSWPEAVKAAYQKQEDAATIMDNTPPVEATEPEVETPS